MRAKNEKAYEKVIEHIKNEIWQGALKRGERLPPERELAETLGVSRNSVREAIRTLGLMGFVSSTQGAGNFVTCDIEQNLRESLHMMVLLGETNVLQISQLRRGLESENARLAAGRIPDAGGDRSTAGIALRPGVSQPAVRGVWEPADQVAVRRHAVHVQ